MNASFLRLLRQKTFESYGAIAIGEASITRQEFSFIEEQEFLVFDPSVDSVFTKPFIMNGHSIQKSVDLVPLKDRY